MADPDAPATRLEQLEFTDDDARILMKSSLLRELDEGDAAVFRPYAHVVLLPRGEKLFDTGDLGDSVYLVITGRAEPPSRPGR